MPETWIIIIAITGGIGLVMFIIWAVKKSKQMKAKIGEVAMAMGADFDPGSWKSQPVARLKVSGRECLFTFHVVSTGQSSVTYLDLKTPLNIPIEKLSIRKATGAGKFFEKIGLNNPLDSGDPYFDEQVAVKGEPEQTVLSVLYGGYFKDPAIQLTQRKYTIELKNDELVASKVYSFKKDMNEPTIRSDLTNLVRIAKALERG